MHLFDSFRRQFAYDEWANREVIAALRNGSGKTERPLKLMAHILSAERVWLDRLQGRPQSVAVWSQWNLEECATLVTEMGAAWREYLDTAAAAGLSQAISYKNSKGESWDSKVYDVLTHVLLHGAYHRGQIASAMRENGQAPAHTDFIHGVRQGLIE
jgi:uncharacterized damage-inducible protein DinB